MSFYIGGREYSYPAQFFYDLIARGNPRRVLLDYQEYLALAEVMPEQYRDFREGDHIEYRNIRIEPANPPRRTDILDLSGGWPTVCTSVDGEV